MIPFNVPPYIGKEDKYIKQAIDSRKICGDGQFTKKCNVKFEEMTGAKKVLMTTSGTSALEMAALLTDIKPGDEAVMPSYTFVSTANAFVCVPVCLPSASAGRLPRAPEAHGRRFPG